MNLLIPAIFFFLINSSSADFGCAKSQTECRLWYGGPCCDPAEKCLEEPNVKKRMCIRPAKLASPCSENADCRALNNGKCSENGTCICQHEFSAGDILRPCTKKLIPDSEKFKFVCFTDNCEQPVDNSWRIRRIGESNLMYGENCTSDDDCKRYNLSSTTCIKGQCRCRSDQVFAYEESSCRPSQNGIGLNCTEGGKCRAENSYCDEFNTCRCKQFHYYKNGECVFDSSYYCPNDFYFNTKFQNCTRYAQNLNDYCFNDESCVHMKRSKCFDNMCLCPDGTKFLGGECMREIGDHCEKPEDCTIPNSHCPHFRYLPNRCTCDVGYHESSDNTMCLVDFNSTKLYDPCDNFYACRSIPNARCHNYRCECHNAIDKNGICYPLVSGNCESLPCQATNSKCAEGTCTCLGPHYGSKSTYDLASDHSACLLYAEKLGDSCVSIRGCKKLGHHIVCSEGKCVCEVGYREFHNSCVGTKGSRCYRDNDCWGDFKCQNEICTCPSEILETGQNCDSDQGVIASVGNFIKNAFGYSSDTVQSCHHDGLCTDVKGSKCINSICQCPGNTKKYVGRCVLPISSYCQKSEDCNVIDSNCINGTCNCNEDFHVSDNQLHCLPFAKRVNDFCISQLDCQKNVGINSFCSKSKCICNSHSIEINGTCSPMIWGSCSKKEPCNVPNSVCRNNYCQCLDGFYYGERLGFTVCMDYAQKPGDSCFANDGCNQIRAATCSNGKCVCNPRYREIDNACSGTSRVGCWEDSHCAEDFKCIKYKCTCPEYAVLTNEGLNCQANPLGVICRKGYYFYLPENRCLPRAKAIGDFCSPSDDCTGLNISRTECKFSTCQCWDDHVLPNGSLSCVRPIGNPCYRWNTIHCNINNSECSKNDKCECKKGYQPTTDNLRCLSSIEGKCDTNEDCGPENSMCHQTRHQCLCKKNYYHHDNNKRCSTSEELGFIPTWIDTDYWYDLI